MIFGEDVIWLLWEAEMGKKVLAVDFDSQANLTICFGVENIGELENTIGHLMMAMIDDAKLPSKKRYIKEKDGVDFIPSSIYLSVVDAKLRLEMGAEKMLYGHSGVSGYGGHEHRGYADVH